jgi:pSer/pThr/pTyr-binding forkhead associated (FHA) protein
MWILRTADTSTPPQTFRLTPGVLRTLGRTARADFVVGAAMISKIHCRFSVGPAGDLEVEDLNSTNGTYVNGRRVSRAVLVAGDRLRVGRLELDVVRAGEQDPAS